MNQQFVLVSQSRRETAYIYLREDWRFSYLSVNSHIFTKQSSFPQPATFNAATTARNP